MWINICTSTKYYFLSVPIFWYPLWYRVHISHDYNLTHASECYVLWFYNYILQLYFTSKGRSIVDYICVPHECVTNCVHFGMHNTKDLITKLNLQGFIGEGCKPPDHAVLELNYRTDFTDEHVTESSLNQNITKRYDFNNISNDFIATPLWAQVCDTPIRRIEGLESTQTHMNDLYADMCSCIFNEMDNNIQYSSPNQTYAKKIQKL